MSAGESTCACSIRCRAPGRGFRAPASRTHRAPAGSRHRRWRASRAGSRPGAAAGRWPGRLRDRTARARALPVRRCRVRAARRRATRARPSTTSFTVRAARCRVESKGCGRARQRASGAAVRLLRRAQHRVEPESQLAVASRARCVVHLGAGRPGVVDTGQTQGGAVGRAPSAARPALGSRRRRDPARHEIAGAIHQDPRGASVGSPLDPPAGRIGRRGADAGQLERPRVDERRVPVDAPQVHRTSGIAAESAA